MTANLSALLLRAEEIKNLTKKYRNFFSLMTKKSALNRGAGGMEMAQIALEIAILALVGLGIIAAENIWLCLGSFLIAAVLIAIYIKKENLR